MTKTKFDRYLERKPQDADFRARFEAADQAWNIAPQDMTVVAAEDVDAHTADVMPSRRSRAAEPSRADSPRTRLLGAAFHSTRLQLTLD